MKRLLLVACFIEVGVALILLPWSAFWDRNYFAQAIPAIHSVITNNFVRGAVSGLGVINVAIGLVELLSMVVARGQERTASIAPPRIPKTDTGSVVEP